jgi:hypothetical protein
MKSNLNNLNVCTQHHNESMRRNMSSDLGSRSSVSCFAVRCTCLECKQIVENVHLVCNANTYYSMFDTVYKKAST